jgi:hypothetical protein
MQKLVLHTYQGRNGTGIKYEISENLTVVYVFSLVTSNPLAVSPFSALQGKTK